jgi:host factor-I protein
VGLGDKISGEHHRVLSGGTSNVPRPLQAAPQPVRLLPKQTPGQRKKPAPPAQTDAESFYYVKQMKLRTPVTVVLNDGEVLRGIVEWYDRWCIKLAQTAGPNYLLYKHSIKYLYKDEDEPTQERT